MAPLLLPKLTGEKSIVKSAVVSVRPSIPPMGCCLNLVLYHSKRNHEDWPRKMMFIVELFHTYRVTYLFLLTLLALINLSMPFKKIYGYGGLYVQNNALSFA